MPALPQGSVSSDLPQRLGLVAGGGVMPELAAQACDNLGIELFIVGFDGQTDEALYEGRRHLRTRIGAIGKAVSTLRDNQISDIVFIGSIRRPSLTELRPDLWTAQRLMRLGTKALGDDGLLKALRAELEKEGFRLHGIQKFMASLLAPTGPVGSVKPDKAELEDIAYGLQIAREVGRLDIGQSVVVQEGIVLGVEAIEGTDGLIRRCGAYRRKGSKPVLVKVAKPQQDQDIDLPTIGPETVRLSAEAGFAGIAVEAGRSLVVEREVVVTLADKLGLFVTGVT